MFDRANGLQCAVALTDRAPRCARCVGQAPNRVRDTQQDEGRKAHQEC